MANSTRSNTAFQWWCIIVFVVSTLGVCGYNIITTGHMLPESTTASGDASN